MDGWLEDPGHIRPIDIAEGLDREYWSDFAEEVSGTYSEYGSEDVLEIQPDDVIKTLETYDPETEDTEMEEAIRNRIKGEVLNPYLTDQEVPEYVENIVTKEFKGLEGEYRLVDQGMARSVFKGPVNSDEQRAVYLPNEGPEPDIYDSDLKNRMAMVAVSMQNTERMDNFVSESFEPVIIADNGRKIPAAVGEFRPIEDVPEHLHDEADDFARELQDRANSGEIITLYTLENQENEFIFGDGFREENVKYDTEREQIVAADAGEIDPNIDEEQLEELLDDKYLSLINSVTH